MSRDGLWIEDETTGEPRFVYYDELDVEVLPQLWKPVGGFCYEADSFVNLSLPKVPFYLEGWLPEQGRLEIYGSAKSGKSYSAVQLARCIGSGVPFAEMLTRQAKVLYIQLELGQRILQDRMKSTGQEYPNVYLGTTFSMKLDTKVGQDYLWRALLVVVPKVLILDPFYKLLRGDENESHDVCVITDFLDAVIEGFQCSIVLYHHPGKDISRGGRGSSVLEDWVDSYVEMKQINKQGEPLRVRLTPKLLRHAELPSKAVELVLENYEFVRADALPSVLEQVQEHASVVGSFAAQDILNAGIGSRRSVYDALAVLQQKGVIKRVKRGEYQWVNSGE